MKVTTKVGTKGLEKVLSKVDAIEKGLTSAEAKAMGEDIVATMKDLISKGISPINGRGRFDGYRGGYAEAIKKGYLSKHGKKQRPVNLTLSGEFLNDLEFRPYKLSRGYGVEIGYFTAKSALKERGHREGANGQAVRPTIPKPSEGFAQRVQRVMREHVKRALKRMKSR